MSLKDKLIKLGSEEPELREHLRPVLSYLKQSASDIKTLGHAGQRWMKNQINHLAERVEKMFDAKADVKERKGGAKISDPMGDADEIVLQVMEPFPAQDDKPAKVRVEVRFVDRRESSKLFKFDYWQNLSTISNRILKWLEDYHPEY